MYNATEKKYDIVVSCTSKPHASNDDVQSTTIICIRTIQSYNVGKLESTPKSEAFKEILSINNIGLRSTSPYVHENATIAERLWMTLEDEVKAVMVTDQIPKRLWPIVFRHGVYIITT